MGASAEEASPTPPSPSFMSLHSPNWSSLLAPSSRMCGTRLHSMRADISSACERLLVVPCMGIPTSVAGVYGFASPFCTTERGKQQDLIGNHALSIKVICPHPLNTWNSSSKAYRNILGMSPQYPVIRDEGPMLQGSYIEVRDVLRCKAPKLLSVL